MLAELVRTKEEEKRVTILQIIDSIDDCPYISTSIFLHSQQPIEEFNIKFRGNTHALLEEDSNFRIRIVSTI